jgi:hypothetical protein
MECAKLNLCCDPLFLINTVLTDHQFLRKQREARSSSMVMTFEVVCKIIEAGFFNQESIA